MFYVGATAFKNGRVAWARRRTSPTDGFHPPLKRIPAIKTKRARSASKTSQEPLGERHAIVHSLIIKFRSTTLVVLTFQQQFGLRLFLPT